MEVNFDENKKTSQREASCNPLCHKEKDGAGDEIRTHDPNLGKVMLYP